MSAKIYHFPNPEQQLEVIDVVSERPRLLDAAAAHVLQVQQKERTNTPLTPIYNYGEQLSIDPALAVPEEAGANVSSLNDYRNRANNEAQSAADSLANMSKELGMTG